VSVEDFGDPSRVRSIPLEGPNEIIILPNSYVTDLAKAEKDSPSSSPDQKQLHRPHPKKRNKAEVRHPVGESHDSGLTGDALDGNPLYGTTLE
jgi:hypothetical protein